MFHMIEITCYGAKTRTAEEEYNPSIVHEAVHGDCGDAGLISYSVHLFTSTRWIVQAAYACKTLSIYTVALGRYPIRLKYGSSDRWSC
jgi:hypothetical protein